jgi:hypothetical protein
MSTKGLPELLFQIEDQLLPPLFGHGISRFHHREASLCKASFQFLPVISFGHFRSPSYFGFAREHGYLSVALPKLNVVAVNKLFCLFRGFGIVGAFEWNRLEEMLIRPDEVNAVIRHGAAPLDQAGALPNSQSPVKAEGRTVLPHYAPFSAEYPVDSAKRTHRADGSRCVAVMP